MTELRYGVDFPFLQKNIGPALMALNALLMASERRSLFSRRGVSSALSSTWEKKNSRLFPSSRA